MKKIIHILKSIISILVSIFVIFTLIVGFGIRWGFSTWGDLNMDEIVFQLQAPLTGTGNGMIADYILKGLLPAILLFVGYLAVYFILRKKHLEKWVNLAGFLSVIVALFVIRNVVWERLDMEAWLEGQKTGSRFIEENYVFPQSVDLEFPEKKRNLIYIYLESVETSYANKESGGAFEKNCIPELTDLAKQNEDFSGDSETLNGCLVFSGTTFTSGAMFASISGLPLKISIGGNNMDTQSSFFPEIVTLGDILEQNDYSQVLMFGSDATFGGRRLMYIDHGNFEINDYLWAKKEELIPEDYKVWWGYEDEKMFSYAKEKLLELAAGSQPFNLTLLTADTHFEDGYVCELCDDEFGDNQYANVMACSSRQVTEFINWVQEQPFYDNTTIVVCGDHTTMDKDFFDGIDLEGYRRKTFVSFINSAVERKLEERREYCIFDMFPTVLASLGVHIKGERLGLGTNLFSETPTLTESVGEDTEREELGKRSVFLEQMEKMDDYSPELIERYKKEMKLSCENYNEAENNIAVRVHTAFSSGMSIARMEVVYTLPESDEARVVELSKDPENNNDYVGMIDFPSWDTVIRINMYITEGAEYTDVLTGTIEAVYTK